jgi:hypothetical protein
VNAATPHKLKHSAVLRSGAVALGACVVASLAGCSTKGVAVSADPVAAVRNAVTANKVHTAKVATSVTMSVDGKDQLFIGDGSFDLDKQIGVIVLTIPQVATPLEEVITPTTLYLRRVGQEAKWRWVAGAKLPDGDVISAGYTSPTFDFALLRGVTAGAVHYVGQDTVRGTAVAHYTGVLDLDSSAAESSDPIRADLLAASRSFTQKTIPFDAYLDAQGNVRRVVAHFTFPAEAPAHGAVQIAATTDLYDLDTPVTVNTPPAADLVSTSAAKTTR